MLLPIMSLLAAIAADSARDSLAAPVVAPLVVAAPAAVSARRDVSPRRDPSPRRAPAIEYSEWYGRRLTIHRIGSYAMLPLFAGEYVLGDKLMEGEGGSNVRSAHSAVAGAIGGLFVVNTVTGAWNLWDSRKDPAGRTRRILHSSLMLAADAGFVVTGVLAGDASEGESSGADRHRAAALTSIGIATVGTAMMWLWKD